MPLAANTRLGPYEVLGPLNSGGMGEVYRARDTQLDREVALKVLRRDLLGDSNAISRFQREAKLAGGLNHPHIIYTDFNDAAIAPALSPDGRMLTFVMRVARTEDEFRALPGAKLLPQANVFSSGSATRYLTSQVRTYSNLFRVYLPE